MSKREWKPGDVVVSRGERGIVTTAGIRDSVDAEYIEFGAGNTIMLEEAGDDIRPLVVIDPEDREQVERFVSIYFAEWDRSPDARRIALPGEVMPLRSHVPAAQAALREFVNPTPPKPEEPQSLGAVIEDGEGLRWTRVESGDAVTRNPWYPAADVQPEEYADIAAVRVLSEGVTE